MDTIKSFKKQIVGAFFLVACLGLSEINAATITSASGGTWSNSGTWVGGTVPGSGDDVIIANGHFVTLDATETIASLTVNATSFTVLTITAGDSLIVTGDVTMTGSASASLNRISLNGTLLVSGNINLNGSGNSDRAHIDMTSNSMLGMGGQISFGTHGKITAADPSTFKYMGTSTQAIDFDANITYRDLVLANTSGTGVTIDQNIGTTDVLGDITIETGILNASTYTITGNSGMNFTIQDGGSLIIGTGSAMPSTFTHVISSGGTVEYGGGSQTITAPNSGEYGNLVLSGSGTKTLGANISMAGNLSISGTVSLDVSSGNNYSLTVGGNWVNSGGTFTARSGTVTFDGTGSQAITSSAESFYDVVFNNSGGSFTLNDNMSVSNSITMTDGVITTGSNRIELDNSSASALSGYSSASFVNGTLRRAIASNTSTYAFPVGNGEETTSYYLAEIENNNLATTSTLTASFGALANHNDVDMSSTDYYIDYGTINTAGTWTISPDAQPTGGNYNVMLYIGNMSGLVDNEFGPLKRPEGSTSGADWTTGGGNLNPTGGAGRMVADGYGKRYALTSFSEFGMGGKSASGSGLPIELISFDADLTNEGVELTWETAAEINNNYFTIEKSTDGIKYDEVTKVEGAGNSSTTISYSTLDANPAEGTSYYRLKQTDYDGSFEYSGIVSVKNIKEVTTLPSVNVYPNPITKGDVISFDMMNFESESHFIQIFDAVSGKLVFKQTLTQDGVKSIKLPTEIPVGLYIIRIQNDEIVSNKKLIIQ